MKTYECTFALGDVVKDRITGFKGVVIGVTFWLNGCCRVTVQPQELKDGRPIDTDCFDDKQLELVEKEVEPQKEKRGGPMPRVKEY